MRWLRARRWAALGVLVATALLCQSSPMWAQGAPAAASAEDDRTAVARDSYASGKQAADGGDYAAAYEHFKLAHNLIPTAHTAYWLAVCVDQLGQTQGAIDAYQAFLTAPDRKQVGEDRITAAKSRIAELRVQLTEHKKVARTAYTQGTEAANAGDFAAAHGHFKRAHALLPTAHTAYWMAVCLDRQGQTSEALKAYEEFLAHPDRNQAGNERVADAESRAKVLRAQSSAPAPSSAQPSIIGGTTADTGIPTVMGMGELSQGIDDLQAEIRSTHHQLKLLSDTVMAGSGSSGRAQIRFVSEMSGAFRLSEVLFVLDGAVQYKRKDTSGSLAKQSEIPIFTGAISAGEHTIQVLIRFKGHGHGVFSYLRGYTFEVKSTHAFRVHAGKALALDVVAWERGSATTPLDQRPALRFNEKVTTGAGRATQPRPPAGGR